MGVSDQGDGAGAAGVKPPRPSEETAEVMVTVKTYPNPSETYGETVCVAGVRLDRGGPEWIRLYPVKFRNADFDSQFRKRAGATTVVSSVAPRRRSRRRSTRP